jgi:hypothetical protein
MRAEAVRFERDLPHACLRHFAEVPPNRSGRFRFDQAKLMA